jgi:hypothetical protein
MPDPNVCSLSDCGYISDGCNPMLCGKCTEPTVCGGGGAANRCGGNNTWPLWPMPDSKTIYCSDGTQMITCPAFNQFAYGQDGDFSINLPSYVVDSNVVSDPITGLMWERNVLSSSPTVNWTDAHDHCRQLSLAGFEDWRLPSRIELLSLADLGQTALANLGVNATAFPNTPFEPFWTSSLYAFDMTRAWAISAGGAPISFDKNMLFRARCVRNR